MLQIECLFAKIGADTAENEPNVAKMSTKFHIGSHRNPLLNDRDAGSDVGWSAPAADGPCSHGERPQAERGR